MKPTLKTLIAIMMMVFIFCASGCGDGTSVPSNPTMPSNDEIQMTSPDTLDSAHQVLGVYNIVQDPESGEYEIVQSRNADHFNISAFIKPFVTCKNLSPAEYHPKFAITIKNPTTATVYDVRIIVIPWIGSSTNFGNPENFTGWFSPYPGWVNGFRAYAKNVNGRAFNSGAEHTEIFDFPGTPDNPSAIDADLVITCSAPGNCTDPFDIVNVNVNSTIPKYSDAIITMDVWRHGGTAVYVELESWQVTGENVYLSSTDGIHWTGKIRNLNNAPSGEYTFRIVADAYTGQEQDYTGDTLYDFVTVWVL